MRKISGIGGRGRSKKCYFPSDKLFCELQAYTDLCKRVWGGQTF